MNKIDFIPFPDKIVVLPLKADTFFEEGKLQEVGMVVAIGSGVEIHDAKIKVGDTVYFNAEGIRKTQKIKDDDIEYYVISVCPEFILGKKNGKTKKESTLVK